MYYTSENFDVVGIKIYVPYILLLHIYIYL